MYEYTLRELIDKLNNYTKAYDEGQPLISDKEYDDLYFQLNKLEQESGIIYPDSPTQSINFQVMSKLNKVTHDHPMLSLDKTKDISNVESFISKSNCIFMLKLDGLTASLRYENGKLISAETRGNGFIGEDILHNIIHFESIPLTIPYKDTLVIDGEIICDTKTFTEKFLNDFANPRNYAAGAIRRLDSKENQNSGLSFITWDCIKGMEDKKLLSEKLNFLFELGFQTVPFIGMPSDNETVKDNFECLQELAKRHNYPIDGIVIKYNNCEYYNSLGNTEHHFRGGLAYKFYDEEYESQLKDIEWSLGRTGVLTPVAIYDDVEIDGTVCNRASLHNVSVLRDTMHTPYVGQKVKIAKMNMIIPQVVWADDDWTIDKPVLLETMRCPVCGKQTKLVESDSGVLNLVCDNVNCEGQLLTRIDHFCSKKGLDIKGLSRKTIEKLIDWGWLNSIFDLFTLRIYKKEWVNKDGFGEASVSKILDSIDAAKCCRLDQFIAGLGIPLVGTTVAKEICKYYGTWEDFRGAVGGDWTEFDGFGPEISKAINSFNYSEADKIAKLFTALRSTPQPKVEPAAAINGKKFCVTGKVTRFKNRDELKADIEAHGGKLVGSVTSATDYLITNTPDSGTAKNRDAQKLGVTIITEEQYLKMRN